MYTHDSGGPYKYSPKGSAHNQQSLRLKNRYKQSWYWFRPVLYQCYTGYPFPRSTTAWPVTIGSKRMVVHRPHLTTCMWGHESPMVGAIGSAESNYICAKRSWTSLTLNWQPKRSHVNRVKVASMICLIQHNNYSLRNSRVWFSCW